MIVRIMSEGQFEVDGATLDTLNQVDNEIVEAIAAEDHSRFHALMLKLHDIVVAKGKPVGADVFRESDLILPPADASMDEVRDMFAGEGLIPG